MYFNFMKSNQDKKQHDKQHDKQHGYNNGQYHVSMSKWLWSFFGALVPRGATAKGRGPSGDFSFKVTRCRLLGLGHSFGDTVTPSILCTVCAQSVLESHKHCLLILTLAAWELLRHQRSFRWRVKHADCGLQRPAFEPWACIRIHVTSAGLCEVLCHHLPICVMKLQNPVSWGVWNRRDKDAWSVQVLNTN